MPLGAAEPDPLVDAFAELRDQFVDALSTSPTTVLATPASTDQREDTVCGILIDEAISDPEPLEALLREVAQAAWHSADADTRLRFMQWISAAADRHALRNREARMSENLKGASS